MVVTFTTLDLERALKIAVDLRSTLGKEYSNDEVLGLAMRHVAQIVVDDKKHQLKRFGKNWASEKHPKLEAMVLNADIENITQEFHLDVPVTWK